MSRPFADRLAHAVAERNSNLCLGLDPGPEVYESAGDVVRSGALVEDWCRGQIEAAGVNCVAVKPQLACFERLGPAGAKALAGAAAAATETGLLVVADGKRGDVPHTATAYAEALCGPPERAPGGLRADAFTANPLLGGDSLDALVEVAAEAGAGVFSLVRTSNPGAADLFDAAVGESTVAGRIAAMVGERAASLAGPDSGLSGAGAVIGATEPRHLESFRQAMPDAVFLIPGVGAQGGAPADLGPAVGRGPASVLVPVSRGITASGDPATASARLRDELWTATAT